MASNLLAISPDWTNVVQAIGSLFAIPGAISAFVILFIRDKKRESEIQSLSEISIQLTQMLQASEKRYRNTKKPRISIEYDFEPFGNGIILKFMNSNSQTTLTNYFIECDIEHINIILVAIREETGNQEFSVILNNMPFDLEHFELEAEYQTEEGYLFKQEVSITRFDDQVFISPSFITEK